MRHMQWIEEDELFHMVYAETVRRFRRHVVCTSDAYRDVLSLFDWQRQHDPDGWQNPGHVADLVGSMRMALKGLQMQSTILKSSETPH